MARYEGPLGMVLPPDDEHIRKYTLTDETLPSFPTPGVAASSWYSAFDEPWKDSEGNYWLVEPGKTDFGRIRGGHCYCIAEKSMNDLKSWWLFYDQGREGACVGFGTCRALSILNRRRYDGLDLYYRAQRIDPWDGGAYPGAAPRYDGTATRSGLDVARTEGPNRVRGGKSKGPYPGDGIMVNRWGVSMEDIAASLSPADMGRAILNRGWLGMKNSWRDKFPFEVRVDLEVGRRIWLIEDGEYGVITDR